MERKGQAAMEFLMTYGWAILAAIIAIGVLAYFGVFSPGKYVTGSAILNPPFYANAWNVKEITGVSVELKNNGGEDYRIDTVTVTPDDSSTTCNPINPAASLVAGGYYTAVVTCGGTNFVAGKTFKGGITVAYTKTQGGNLQLTSTGTIAEKIISG